MTTPTEPTEQQLIAEANERALNRIIARNGYPCLVTHQMIVREIANEIAANIYEEKGITTLVGQPFRGEDSSKEVFIFWDATSCQKVRRMGKPYSSAPAALL
jgi:hypothetical protein